MKNVGIPVVKTITAMTARKMPFLGRDSLLSVVQTPANKSPYSYRSAIFNFSSKKIIDMVPMVVNIKRKEQK